MAYYNINKLKMNEGKTAMMIFTKEGSKVKDNDIELKDKENETIKPEEQTRILGWIVNKRQRMDSQLEKTIKSVNLKLMKLKEYLPHMKLHTRKKIANSHVKSFFMEFPNMSVKLKPSRLD